MSLPEPLLCEKKERKKDFTAPRKKALGASENKRRKKNPFNDIHLTFLPWKKLLIGDEQVENPFRAKTASRVSSRGREIC